MFRSVTRRLERPIATLARFHANWNRKAFQPTWADRAPDYTVLKTTGSGRFLGFMLHVYEPNNDPDPKAAPGEYWWGECDEKLFVMERVFVLVWHWLRRLFRVCVGNRPRGERPVHGGAARSARRSLSARRTTSSQRSVTGRVSKGRTWRCSPKSSRSLTSQFMDWVTSCGRCLANSCPTAPRPEPKTAARCR